MRYRVGMQPFHDLKVWHRAQDAAVLVHKLTESFKASRAPGLRGQLRRASASIAAAIAEGAAYDSDRQFARFLQMAIGSAAEVRSHLDLARRLQLITHSQLAPVDRELLEITLMLIALLKRVQRDAEPAS